MIYFRCKNCGALIKVSDRFAGKKGRCAKCGVTNDIPLSSQAVPAAAPSAGEAKAEAAARAKSHAPPPVVPPRAAQVAHAPSPAAPHVHGPAGSTHAPDAPPAAPPTAAAVATAPATEPIAQPRPPRKPSELPIPAAQIDRVVAHLRKRGGSGLFGLVERIAYVVSVYAILALAPFMVIVGLAVLPGKTGFGWTWADKVQMCLALVVGGLLLPLCQYVIAKVRTASVKIVQSSPSLISSTNLLDCIAVLLLVGAVVALGYGIYEGYDTGSWHEGIMTAVGGALVALLGFLLASVALNPSELNVLVAGYATAGQEALGFFSFFWKAVLRFAPIVLLALVAWSLYLLGLGAYGAMEMESVQVLGLAATGVCIGLITFTALYVGVYLLFLAYHLIVDMVLALFQIAVNTRPHERATRLEKIEES